MKRHKETNLGQSPPLQSAEECPNEQTSSKLSPKVYRARTSFARRLRTTPICKTKSYLDLKLHRGRNPTFPSTRSLWMCSCRGRMETWEVLFFKSPGWIRRDKLDKWSTENLGSLVIVLQSGFPWLFPPMWCLVFPEIIIRRWWCNSDTSAATQVEEMFPLRNIIPGSGNQILQIWQFAELTNAQYLSQVTNGTYATWRTVCRDHCFDQILVKERQREREC